jgi:hypothetical protein
MPHHPALSEGRSALITGAARRTRTSSSSAARPDSRSALARPSLSMWGQPSHARCYPKRYPQRIRKAKHGNHATLLVFLNC